MRFAHSRAAALTLTVLALGCGDDTSSGGNGGSGGVAWTGGSGGAGATGGTSSGGGGSGGVSPDGGGGAGGIGPSGGAGGVGPNGGSNPGGGGSGGSGGAECESVGQCDDADACTVDACDAGTCENIAVELEDGFDCTLDACDPATGVTHTPMDMACDDLVDCTDDECSVDTGCANTPNASNCMPGEGCDGVAGCQASTITSVFPNDGLATATTAVTIVGTGLTTGTISFDGIAATCNFAGAPTTVTCNVPPSAVGRGDVLYTNVSGAAATLVDGWTFTGVLNEDDVADEADYCNLQFPTTTSSSAGQPSDTIYGRIFESGKTDVTAGGPASGIIGEVGYGPNASNPTTSAGWRFQPATFNLEIGNDEEYLGTITIPAAGSYAYTFRFSLDGGLNFTYCDSNGAGSNGGLTFEANSLGAITVN